MSDDQGYKGSTWVFLPEYGEAHEYSGSLTCNVHRLTAESAGFTLDSWQVDGDDIDVHTWGADNDGPQTIDALRGWCERFARYRVESQVEA